MSAQAVTAEYLAGIADARATLRKIQSGADSGNYILDSRSALG